MALVIIKNTKRTPCSNCGGVHEYITRPTEGKRCDIPVAYPSETAHLTARIQAHGEEDIERISTGTDVILAEGTRKLPVRDQVPPLRHYETRERLA
jgi:hypothetical protein